MLRFSICPPTGRWTSSSLSHPNDATVERAVPFSSEKTMSSFGASVRETYHEFNQDLTLGLIFFAVSVLVPNLFLLPQNFEY